MTAAAKLQTACRGTQGNCLYIPIIFLATEMARSQPTCSAHLFRWPGRPAYSLRNTRAGLRRSDISKVWGFPRTCYCSDLLLSALSCWDPNSCLDQRGNEILCSLSDLGNVLPACRSCCFLTPALTTSGEAGVVGSGGKGSYFLLEISSASWLSSLIPGERWLPTLQMLLVPGWSPPWHGLSGPWAASSTTLYSPQGPE